MSIPITAWNDSLDTIRDHWDRAVRKPSEVSYALDTYGDLPVDIDEREDRFVIEMDMSKYERDEIKVAKHEGFLRVRATRPRTAADEVTAGSEYDERTFRLPQDVDMGSLVATFDDGKLRIDVSRFRPER